MEEKDIELKKMEETNSHTLEMGFLKTMGTLFLCGAGLLGYLAYRPYQEARIKADLEIARIQNGYVIQEADLNQNGITEQFYVIDGKKIFLTMDGKNLEDTLDQKDI